MALSDLFYRCPECGHDPMSGEGDRAWCTACGTVIERGREDLVLKRGTSGAPRVVTAAKLVKKIEAHGGPLTKATAPDGSIRYSAAALISWRDREDPIRYRGELRGFSEAMGEPASGTVSVDADTVSVTVLSAGEERWRFLEIRAMQTASSSVQLSLPGDRLVQFQFPDDSPRRWEDLFKHLIQEAYRRADRGFIVEFQPRIVTR